MNSPIRRDQSVAMLLLLILPLSLTLFFWTQLPEQIPIHWNSRGEIDGYASKLQFLLYHAGLGAFLFVLFHYLPKLDPKKANYERFGKAYSSMAILTIGFISFINLLILAVALGYSVSMEKVVPVGVFLLMAFLGNYMTTVKPNYFVGIRTPWTLESEYVWRKTHQVGGRIWFFGGILLAALAPFVGKDYFFPFIMIGTLSMAFIPIIYSYWVYRNADQDGLI
jgi:uncharacterized membrane protein